ncbi:MAG TPA: (d)CMP kinase, partial [Spirochaetaceae bacterium]|nr:(d)CMP kinase [Spirochaetaceae bacterium]
MIIAIDGTSASGKSTVASMLAEDLNLVNLNSGNLYRTLSFAVLNAGVDCLSEESTVEFVEKQDLRMDSADTIILNGAEIDLASLRNPQIDSVSSKISFYVPVRLKVNGILRMFAEKYDVVCEGRDITSVVFPETPHKFFIDADVAERARRRTANYNGDYDKVL